MKSLLPILIVVLLVTFTSGCVRYAEKGFDTYFWTSTPQKEPLYLYIDDKKIGLLPYLEEAPVCSDHLSKKQALFIALNTRKHVVEVKDRYGNIKHAEMLKAKRRRGSANISSSLNGEGGNSRRTFSGNCLIEEIYFDN